MSASETSPAIKSATTVEELVAATKDTGIRRILARGDLANAPSIRLSPEQFLQGDGDESKIAFAPMTDGLQLSSDNRVQDIRPHASPDERAISNDMTVDCLGRIELRDATTTSRVQILARDKVRGGHVDVNGLDIVAADVWGKSERPHGYGVYFSTVPSFSGTCSPKNMCSYAQTWSTSRPEHRTCVARRDDYGMDR